MFTGIIQTVGRIESLVQRGEAVRLAIVAPALDTSDVQLGDSIAVSGPCLTAVALGEGRFEADISPETLAKLKKGKVATFIIYDGPAAGLPLAIDLKGFTDALTALDKQVAAK